MVEERVECGQVTSTDRTETVVEVGGPEERQDRDGRPRQGVSTTGRDRTETGTESDRR